ncbi:Mediator of RNA polymerase II transcription subunit 4 [Sparganum proliferum]
MAPDNWVQGDPRRPYPNKKEIRRGYLGYLDDSGNFRPSVNEEFAQAFPSNANTPTSSHPTSGCLGNNTAQSGATPVGHSLHTITNQCGFQTAQTQGPSTEQPGTYSPSIILPGVNMVSSPSATSASNGSQTWNHSSLPGDGSTNAGNSSQSPVTPGQQSRHANSLAAMLGGQGVMNRPGSIAPPGVSPLSRIPQPPCGPPLSGRMSSSPSPVTIASSRQQNTLSSRNSGPRPGVQPGIMFSDSHTPSKLHRRKKQHLEPGPGNESMEKLHTESSESSDEDFKRRNDHISF